MAVIRVAVCLFAYGLIINISCFALDDMRLKSHYAYVKSHDAQLKYVDVEKNDLGRAFVYQCVESGYSVSVEQRYNDFAKSEEIRFVVNDTAGNWITEGISPELFNFFARKACEKSTTEVAVALNQ